MKNSLHGRASGRTKRVTGAILAAVALTLTGLAKPVAASNLTAQSDPVYEGKVVKITFKMANPANFAIRYSYTTRDGSATSGKDYESKSGYVTFPRLGSHAEVTVKTKEDLLCEHTEDFKIVLSGREAFWYGTWTSLSWADLARRRGIPDHFEAVAEIDQHEQGCTAGQFGE